MAAIAHSDQIEIFAIVEKSLSPPEDNFAAIRVAVMGALREAAGLS
jgi:hypothetical protein